MREQYRMQIKVFLSDRQDPFEKEVNKFLLKIEDPNPEIIFMTNPNWRYCTNIKYKIGVGDKI